MSARRPWPVDKIRELCAAEAFLRVEDVAAILGRSRSALYGAIQRGQTPFRVVKLGKHRSWLVPSADVLALIEPQPDQDTNEAGAT